MYNELDDYDDIIVTGDEINQYLYDYEEEDLFNSLGALVDDDLYFTSIGDLLD